MKATAFAPANIAFIKYWGKSDTLLRIPTNPSISMNLSAATTTTTVEFSDAFDQDMVTLIDGDFSQSEKQKVIAHLDRIRKLAKVSMKAKVVTKNSFPKGAGVASSASGFAALTLAGCLAAGMSLSEKELTVLARIGSGSACRSVPDGFVKWVGGSTSEESFAYSLYPAKYWDLRDVLVVVDDKEKAVATTAGMEAATTSPFWHNRLKTVNERISLVECALATKDFRLLGTTIEEECLDMHHVMQTQASPICYWNDSTKEIMNAVMTWRKSGLPVYFTIDAGPNVHLICQELDEQAVVKKAQTVEGVRQIVVNRPSQGAHMITKHLF